MEGIVQNFMNFITRKQIKDYELYEIEIIMDEISTLYIYTTDQESLSKLKSAFLKLREWWASQKPTISSTRPVEWLDNLRGEHRKFLNERR